ncbi:MAG: ATPase, T2SS/T4P/T4SS family, partial [Mariprofundaceae bacterium]
MAAAEPVPGGSQHRRPLGQKLLDAGLITQEQLTLSLHEQKHRGVHLGEALVGLGFISDDMLSTMLAQEIQAETADLADMSIGDELLRLIPLEMAKRFLLIPLAREGQVLAVGMADPFDVMAIDAVEKATGLSLDVSAASEQAIREALEHQYAQSASMEQTLDELMQQGHAQLGVEAGDESPMIRLVDQIITQAIKSRATDIHVEPDSSVLRLRMRIDGVMQQKLLIPKPMQAVVTARLKIMAGMDVTEKRLPQDGRISFNFGLREVDLRVSTMPTCHGENLVLRVLDRDETTMNIQSLGMAEREQGIFIESLARPQGLILVTGPTGSGKTTTLYSAMSHVSSVERSVFTLEDPIEYRMPLI